MRSVSSVVALTPLEHGLLRGGQALCQRWVFRVFAVVVAAYVVGRTLRLITTREDNNNPRSTTPAAPVTLYDPERLQKTLNLFAEAPTIVGGGGPGHRSGGERHRTEALCRTLLEAMLGVPLPKVRPKWLTNPTTKRALELDLYSQDLRLAFEFDGSQHDYFTPHFHRNEDHFRYRQLLDKLKGQMCQEAGVRLLRIPWNEVSVSDEARTAAYLERLLKEHGIPFRSVLVPARNDVTA